MYLVMLFYILISLIAFKLFGGVIQDFGKALGVFS